MASRQRRIAGQHLVAVLLSCPAELMREARHLGTPASSQAHVSQRHLDTDMEGINVQVWDVSNTRQGEL